MKKQHKGFIILISIVILVILIISVVFIFWRNKAVVNDIADWKTYKNATYGFDFKYPANYTIEEDKKSKLYDLVIEIYSPDTFVHHLGCLKGGENGVIDCPLSNPEIQMFSGTNIVYSNIEKTNFRNYQKININNLDISSYMPDTQPPSIEYSLNFPDGKTSFSINADNTAANKKLIEGILSTVVFTK